MSCHFKPCHMTWHGMKWLTWHTTSCRATLCDFMSFQTMSCHAIPYYAIWCLTMSCHFIPCHVMRWNAVLCHVTSSSYHVKSRHAIPCYVVQCVVISCHVSTILHKNLYNLIYKPATIMLQITTVLEPTWVHQSKCKILSNTTIKTVKCDANYSAAQIPKKSENGSSLSDPFQGSIWRQKRSNWSIPHGIGAGWAPSRLWREDKVQSMDVQCKIDRSYETGTGFGLTRKPRYISLVSFCHFPFATAATVGDCWGRSTLRSKFETWYVMQPSQLVVKLCNVYLLTIHTTETQPSILQW